jgi:hypothetical protein
MKTVVLGEETDTSRLLGITTAELSSRIGLAG